MGGMIGPGMGFLGSLLSGLFGGQSQPQGYTLGMRHLQTMFKLFQNAGMAPPMGGAFGAQERAGLDEANALSGAYGAGEQQKLFGAMPALGVMKDSSANQMQNLASNQQAMQNSNVMQAIEASLQRHQGFLQEAASLAGQQAGLGAQAAQWQQPTNIGGAFGALAGMFAKGGGGAGYPMGPGGGMPGAGWDPSMFGSPDPGYNPGMPGNYGGSPYQMASDPATMMDPNSMMGWTTGPSGSM